MRSYEREPDVGDVVGDQTGQYSRALVEWEYVPTRRRPGAPDGSLPVRLLLIDVGTQLVDRRGPGAISVAECARRVGVSKGAPFTWFEDAADFRCAVAAQLLSVLVADLAEHAPYVRPGHDPVALLRVDVGLIVRNWAANGMGVEHVFARGGPASDDELAWSAERFVGHLRGRVHWATGCTCALATLCRSQRALVDALLAHCHGFAALARSGEAVLDAVVAAAESSVVRLLGCPAAESDASRERT